MGFYLPSGGGKLGKFLEEERLLSEYSGDKEELELEVETPLTIAVTRNKPQAMITALVAGGAQRDYFSKFGLTPLHKAAAVGNYEAVKAWSEQRHMILALLKHPTFFVEI
ncbi:hypothetical protein X801_00659 [Opisthorchis viverrini]|uniref:Uncharacterized protein n=1 Tax=Opisthorchis viverrini TaxID=6198 RepID=A0A1S8X9Q0_OPIVI|nr:hypothetical protein X801_00659 [Opisthorchis viverrini]